MSARRGAVCGCALKLFEREIAFDNSERFLKLLAPILDGVVAQLVERLNGIQEVRGSNPLGSTTLFPPNTGL